jgi:hypothetical protein
VAPFYEKKKKYNDNHSKIIITFIFIFIFLLNTDFSFTQTSGGGYSESYLLRNLGARSIAMAGAYTAVVNEPNSIFYNPAGLTSLSNRPSFSSMFSFLEFGRTHSSLSWGQSVSKNLGVGVGINNFTSGNFTARDIQGNSIGTMQDWQFSITGGMAYSLEFVSFGGSVKYLANSLQSSGTRADGFSVDLGSKFNVMDMFSFGLAIQNLSGFMFWNDHNKSKENNMLPYTIRSGVAMEFNLNGESTSTRSNIDGELEEVTLPSSRYVLLSFDGIMTQYENSPTFTLGIEVAAHEIIQFRGGIALLGDNMGKFELFPMTIWGGGVSIKPPLKDLPFTTSLEYSISQDKLSRSKISHHFSLVIDL